MLLILPFQCLLRKQQILLVQMVKCTSLLSYITVLTDSGHIRAALYLTAMGGASEHIFCIIPLNPRLIYAVHRSIAPLRLLSKLCARSRVILVTKLHLGCLSFLCQSLFRNDDCRWTSYKLDLVAKQRQHGEYFAVSIYCTILTHTYIYRGTSM